MNMLRVFLSCTLLLLCGCSEHKRQEQQTLGSKAQSYQSAQEACAQQQATCTYAYSPAWHDVLK